MSERILHIKPNNQDIETWIAMIDDDVVGHIYMKIEKDDFMFGSSDISASTQIYRMDKNDPDFIEKSVDIMKQSAKREGIELIRNKDIITLIPCGESRVSYSPASIGDTVETEGKYKGLKKTIYTPYDIMFNETKAGFNPHEFDVMGIWNQGNSIYSCYRIWEEKTEREKAIRDNKLKLIGL